jgi:hypothetical protein
MPYCTSVAKVRGTKQIVLATTLALAAALCSGQAAGQAPAATAEARAPTSSVTSSPVAPVVLNFDISGTKFGMESLMRVLKDSKHEGWVLAAYPDPKTSRPLIGAGFSLDVEAREHAQSDPLNTHLFLEPSSAQLWQTAGLDPEQLKVVLEQFDRNLAKWNKKGYRKKIKTHQLKPQLTETEATQLLRVSATQAVHNAKAYCRNFDELTASQQMALSQLVFQMGVNLEEFVQFLAALNGNPVLQDVALTESSTDVQPDQWKQVQQTLIDSQWARHYTTRAITVIAMFDPTYEQNPKAAEQGIQAVLRPPPEHKRKKSHGKPTRATKSGGSIAKAPTAGSHITASR